MKKFLISSLIALVASATASAADCANGKCAVGQRSGSVVAAATFVAAAERIRGFHPVKAVKAAIQNRRHHGSRGGCGR